MTDTNDNRDLLNNPLWRAEDVGKPMPDSPHSVSVAMPLWEHVVAYEEGDPAFRAKLALGYPRFIYHPFAQRLFQHAEAQFARPGELCLVLPTQRVAERCVAFIREMAKAESRIEAMPEHRVFAVCYPSTAAETAKHFWQHFGEIVSSRQAETIVDNRTAIAGGVQAKTILKSRIASWIGAPDDDVYLYPTGMAALASAQRIVHTAYPDVKSVQLGFSYVDLLKIQEKRGPGVHFLPCGKDAFDRLKAILASEKICGVFCEFPSNPLLECCDLEKLSNLLRQHGVPLIVDETLGTFLNVDVLQFADIVMSSLTKYVSGSGDVMAGSLVFSAASPLYAKLTEVQRADYEDLVWRDDASVLEVNSRDFTARMSRINATAEALCDHLRAHPLVESVAYPKYTRAAEFERCQRNGGGYGGLFSVVTKDPARTAARFYDALRVCKGPSLGNNFTLACPFTLLAHYGELDWAESLGVSRYLVRVSVGLEDTGDLIQRFDEALKASA